MCGFKIGDIVARKSYDCDVFFKVVDIQCNRDEKIITLKGITCRLEADAPEADLVVQEEQTISEYTKELA